jgi:protein O-GlcNAc transferase
MAPLADQLAIAVQHHQAGRFDAAEQIYRQLLTAAPTQPETLLLCNNLGLALYCQGRPADAIACYEQALGLEPRLAEAHKNLGDALKDLGRLAEASACYQRALVLQPDNAGVYNNLGIVLDDQGRFAEASACFQSAIRVRPDFVDAHCNLGKAWKDQGLVPEAIGCFRRAVQINPAASDAHSYLAYTLLFCPDYDAQAIFAEHRRWNQQHAEPLAKLIRPHRNERSPGRRLRIGYVSPDFCDHVVGRNLLPLFREHDHRQFEITCYANMSTLDAPSSFTARFKDCSDAWRDVAGLTDEQLAQRVREDRIDILVDLTLHMAGNRLLVFARKPAPVQVTFAGYPGTTGLTAIDYRLTDPYLDPPGADWSQSASEEPIRLPDSFWCYDPISNEPAVHGLPALTNGFLTFGSFNNFCKLNAFSLRLWAKVLRATGTSRLILLAPEGDPRLHVLGLLDEEGIAAERVTFVSIQPRPQYLELYHRVDLGLDTLPYNGHTTSLDSTWMGVPVVTLHGETVVGRAGVSLLSNLGLRELIAHTPEEMVRIILELAADLPRLSTLRATLRARMQASPLMDAPRFARAIEAAYREMWQRWCKKENEEGRRQNVE